VHIARIPNPPTPAVQGGPALFQLVRFWSRRWLRDDHATPDDHALDILVLEAVDAAKRSNTRSVNDVATQLGLDRSGASRLISAATSRGYLTRRTQTADARRVELQITRSGRALLNAARRWQSAAFLDLVADWDPADVEAFAAYLVRLADAVLNNSTQDDTT